MAHRKVSAFPSQLIPDKEKNEEWCSKMIDAIAGYIYSESSIWEENVYADIKNYSIYNGDWSTDDYKYLTEQYGFAQPARLVNYPIITPKIDLLLGEELRRPLDMKVVTINKDAALRKEDYKIRLILKKYTNDMVKELGSKLGFEPRTQLDGLPMPEDIDKFMEYQYKEAVEEVAQDGLNYLLQKYSFREIFKAGFRDLLVTGKEFYKVYVKNGDPYIRRVDPRAVAYDTNTDSDYLDEAQWIGEERWLTPNEILDEFRDQLTKEDLEFINEMQHVSGYDDYKSYNTSMDWVRWSQGEGSRIRVLHCEWKSIKSIKYKISENKYDPERPFYKQIPDNYKKKKGDVIRSKYIDDIWIGTKIGGQILVDCRRRPNQVRSVDDPGSAQLSYVGYIKNNTTGKRASMVDMLKNVQFLYNIVMYHIELALARSGGKAVVYDVSQLPTNLGMDMQTVLYHLKTDGIIPINSKDEGGQVSNFNQFSQVDFTLSQSVQQLINLKMMLEDMAGQISGVTKQREGAVEQYEYVGNVQRSVLQSATITESWFYAHGEVKKRCLLRMCELMKIAWSQGKKASMVFGDGASKILNVFPDIAFNDYGIFVGDAGKDDAMRQSITQLSQAALSSGQITLLDIIKVFKAETMTEAERVLEQGLEAARKVNEEQQAQQQQMMEMQAQQEDAKFQREVQLKQIDNEAKIQVAQIQSETDIAVAEINDESKRDIADMKEKISVLKDREKNSDQGSPNTDKTNDGEALEKIKDKINE
tara:strand:- start:299 stop:2569 length:2271 start_codon:yes stop_codon:yes gene_type:complete